MKKILYSIFFCSLLFAVSSCKKTDGEINPLSSLSNFGIGAYLVLDSTLNTNFNLNTLASSQVGVKVHEKPGADPIDHIDIYTASSNTYDTTKWKFIKSVPYTDGVLLTATGTELAKAFGVAISTFQPGTSYYFYNRIFTKSGARYDVNNTGTNGGSGLLGGPTYNASFSFSGSIVCPFVAPAAGTYKVIADDWQDNAVGDLVKVTDGKEANTIDLSGVWPGPTSGYAIVDHLIIKVNPTTGAVTIPTTNFEDEPPVCFTTGGSGYVFSCTGQIKLSIAISAVGYGAQGNFILILQKQ